jgi:Ca2+-binding EF-hand superfamily protein
LQLFPFFEDFDQVHHGYISQNQFLRTLNKLDLFHALTDSERNTLIEKFRVQVGGRADVDYTTFCHQLNALAGFDAGQP